MHINNSTISGNNAGQGGGIYNNITQNGALNIGFSTITANKTGLEDSRIPPEDRIGGGIYNPGPFHAKPITMAATILAGNRTPFIPPSSGCDINGCYSPDCVSTGIAFFGTGITAPGGFFPTSFISFRRNLVGVWNQNCNVQDYYYRRPPRLIFTHPPVFLFSGDGLGTPEEPLVPGISEMLADNGGPTLTHALMPGSRAIDHAHSITPPIFDFFFGGCPETDQRGFLRPDKFKCDTGAFELGASPP
jgi:hypothetical protein